MNLTERCQQIELLLTDVDGVLTDGGVIIDNQGVESKRFSIRDGQGIRLWQQAGHKAGIVTGRSSQIVILRAGELDIDILRQGVKDKLPMVESICEEMGLKLDQIAYVGDDLPDLPVINRVGLGVAVADAAEEVKAGAAYTTSVGGGQGAIRELIEVILKNTNRWESTIRRFTA